MKKTILLLLILCRSICFASTNDSQIVLSTVYDEYINANDPRIGSLIFIQQHTPRSHIQLEYSGADGRAIVSNLVKSFSVLKIDYDVIENVASYPKGVIITLISSSAK